MFASVCCLMQSHLGELQKSVAVKEKLVQNQTENEMLIRKFCYYFYF